MIKAVGKRLIVQQITEEKAEEKKGLIIPGDENKPFKARVIAFGTDTDCNVEPGNYVLLPYRTGTPIDLFGEKYLVIFEDQILAVMDK